MKKPPAFGPWLRQQTGRDDPTGDLARDFREDGSPATTVGEVHARLSYHRADPEAFVALEKAEAEWKNLTDPNKEKKK